jgi:hypothetical protein
MLRLPLQNNGDNYKTSNTKHQAPDKLRASSIKARSLRALAFGAWSFFGIGVWCFIWSLVFGV